LHRLAALIPAPYLHLTRYSGIFAPNAHRRWEMTAAGIRHQSQSRAGRHVPAATATIGSPLPSSIPWAELLARTFKIDVLQCPRCEHGRLDVIAFITDALVVRKILAHLGLPAVLPAAQPIVRTDQLALDLGASASPARATPPTRPRGRPSGRAPPPS
jgi:hypothetical protein